MGARRPYVSVTGVSSEEEVDGTINLFSKYGFDFDSDYLPFLGFLVSRDTVVRGEQPRKIRYPFFGALPRLLEKTRNKAVPAIHYCTRKSSVFSEIKTLFDTYNIYDDCRCKAVQLNTAWPKPEDVSQIKNEYPNMRIILQLSKYAMDGLKPEQIAERVVENYSNVDYVLVDPSGGKGIGFEPVIVSEVYKALKNKSCSATIGFAGGLSGENVSGKISELEQELETRNFSLDAESKLMSEDQFGHNRIDLDKVEKYLKQVSCQ